MSTAIVCVHSVGSNMLCTGFDRALFCGVVPQFVRYSRLHLVRMVLNVVVLGLWSGTFVSYVVLLNLFSNGVSLISVLLSSVCRYHQCCKAKRNPNARVGIYNRLHEDCDTIKTFIIAE